MRAARRTRRGRKPLQRAARVDYHCRSEKHLAKSSRHGVGGLTIHNDAWAYCDGSDSDDEHVWESTGGAPLEQLVRWSGAISKFRAAQRTA